nr:2-hydroxyacyl-CoA dehydratase [Desulfobacterales bacterium]
MFEDFSVPYMPSENQAIVDWKDEGGRVIGYFCQSFPKEIIYAAGILPVRILGNSKPIERGNDFWCRFACYLSRSAIDLALKGELDLLDGTVFTYTCDTMPYLTPRWQQIPSQRGKFWYYLTRPLRSDTEGARKLFRRELEDLKEEIEKHFQVSITDASLRKAIGSYNENRALLREVDSLKKMGLINSVEAAKVTFTSMLWPPDKSNDLLRSFIAEAKQNREPAPEKRIRFFVSGAMLHNTELFELIEEEGGIVIGDDLCTAGRYIRGSISQDQDPLDAVASYYLAEEEPNWQCPSMLTENRLDERLRYIEEAIANHDIHGVVFTTPIYCDMNSWDRVWLVHRLEEKGIRTLILDQEGYMKTDAIRNRIAAFIETIK